MLIETEDIAERVDWFLTSPGWPAEDAPIPSVVRQLDAAARSAVADLNSALKADRRADASAALSKINMAQQQIRDVFETGHYGHGLYLVEEYSRRWTDVASMYRDCILARRS